MNAGAAAQSPDKNGPRFRLIKTSKPRQVPVPPPPSPDKLYMSSKNKMSSPVRQ
jgi:hypothetical protein